MSGRLQAVDEFYELLDDLERRCGGKRRLAECDASSKFPKRGVYFFFEDGEFREDATTLRVTRIGTHGLAASKARPDASKPALWRRLRTHKGSSRGPRGGNHRRSIFRKHMGRALLESDVWPEEIGDSWGDRSAASGAKKRELPLEQKVSSRIGAMQVLCVEVGDEPGPNSDRGVIEKGSIALLSNHERPSIDRPSDDWLGLRSDQARVKSSGLWNVNHVQDQPSAEFLATLRRHILAHQ